MGDEKKRSRRVQLENGAARKYKTSKRGRNVDSGRDGRTSNELCVAGLAELVEDIQNHLRLHSIQACTGKEKGGQSPLPVYSCASLADHALSVLSLLADASLSPSARSSQVSELSLFLLFLLGPEPPECDGLGKMLESQQGRLKVWELVTCMIQLTPITRFACVSDRVATAIDALVAHWQQGPIPSLCSCFMEDAVRGIEICEDLLRCPPKTLRNNSVSHSSPKKNVMLFCNLGEVIGGKGVKVEVTSPFRPECLLAFLTLVIEKLAKHHPQFVVGTSLIWRMWKHLMNQLTSILMWTENENTGNTFNQLLSAQLKAILTILSLESPPPNFVSQRVSLNILALLEEIFVERKNQFPFSGVCLEYLDQLVNVVFLSDEHGSHTTTTTTTLSISSILPTVSTWCIRNEVLLQEGGLTDKCELACIVVRSVAKHIRHCHSVELHFIPYLCDMAHVWQLQTPVVDCITAVIYQLSGEVQNVLLMKKPSPLEELEISRSMHALPEWAVVRLVRMTEKEGKLKRLSDLTRLTSVIRILLPFFAHRFEDSYSIVSGRLLHLITLFLRSFTLEVEDCEKNEECVKSEEPLNTAATITLTIRMDCCLSILRWAPNLLQTLNDAVPSGNVGTIATAASGAGVAVAVQNLILRCLTYESSGFLSTRRNKSPKSFDVDTTVMETNVDHVHYLQPLQRTLILAFCFYPWSTEGFRKLLNRIENLLSSETPEHVQCMVLLSLPILVETYLAGDERKDRIQGYELALAAVNVYSNHLDTFLISDIKGRRKGETPSSRLSFSKVSSIVKRCISQSVYLLACVAASSYFCIPDEKKCAVSDDVLHQQEEMCHPPLPMGIRVAPASCQMQQFSSFTLLGASTESVGLNFKWLRSENMPMPVVPNLLDPPPPPPPTRSVRVRIDILCCCRKLAAALLQDCITESSQIWLGTLPLIVLLIQCESHKDLQTVKEVQDEEDSNDGNMGRIVRMLLEAISEKGDSGVGNAVALIAGVFVLHETTILRLLNFTHRKDLGKLIDGTLGGCKPQQRSNSCKEMATSTSEQSSLSSSSCDCFPRPEYQCHLRAIGSIGSSANISSDGGRYWIMWTLLRLIHVWADKQSPFQFMAFDEMRRVCQSTSPPVLELFTNDNVSGCEEVLPKLLEAVLKYGRGYTERFLEQVLCVRDTRAWLDTRLHHILPTLISNRQMDTMEHISMLWDHIHNGELSQMQKASIACKPPSLASCLMLRSNTIRCVIKEILLGSLNAKSELNFVVQTFYPQNKPKHFLHEQLEPVLCLVARELGGKRHDAADRAINRITSILESHLYHTARDMVRDKFLYLMSHVVAKSSPLRPQLDRHQAILVLEELVSYFNAEDSACFAPKVFATLSSTLADPSARVGHPIRETAYRIACNYTRVLPVAALGTHLSTIVVTLLPALLEEEISFRSNVRAEALDLLHYLVVAQRKALRAHFCSIPFLPTIPELEHISAILEEEVGRPALADQLQQLSKLLQHEESIAVQLALLRHLLQVLQDSGHRGELGTLLAPSDNVDTAIEKLLGCLLRISSSSGNVEVRDICASCLGQIGAVDPSHIPSLRLGEWSAGLPTWGFSTEDLSLLLLREHLVPALRAATSSIDRVAYGIQELVHLMQQSRVDENQQSTHHHYTPLLEEERRMTGDESSTSKRKRQKEGNDKMPEWLISTFREDGILDAVEPFWITNYILRDSMDPSMQFPIFHAQIASPAGSSLERYISLWCRHLISNSHGPMQHIFKSCRGVVRASIGVAQYLLPHLAVDVILFGTESDREDLLSEVVAVLSVDDLEKGGGKAANSFHHVAIQAIFKLLDTLNEWTNGGTPPLGTNWPKPRERLYALRNFIELIPRNVLIDASVGIRAHTRALLYLEEELRILTRGDVCNHQVPDMSLNDGANGTLPALTAHSLQQLVDIYRRISSEPDAMSGLEVLRCKHGCPQTLKQRIWQHEHAEEWFEALQVYEHTLQSSRPGESSSNSSLHVGHWDPGERELGVLRCHMSLGQYQLVLHQANGMLMMPTLGIQNPIGSLILPLAIEASWRLQRWSLTEDLLHDYDETLVRCKGSEIDTNATASRLTSHEPPPSPLLPEDSFRVALARVLLLFHGIKVTTSSKCGGDFEGAVRTARAEVMGQLAAASMESYQRAYPFLLQLHTLAEVEQMWLMRRQQNPVVGVRSQQQERQQPTSSSSMVTFESLDWSSRLELLAPNLRQVEPLLAVRQAILQNESMDSLAVENFLCLGKAARVATCFSVAACALERAGMLDKTDLAKERLVMQEAKLAYARGKIDRALLILEPMDLNVGSVRQQWLSQRSAARGEAMRIKQYNFARRLLWATNWMVESGQCHGQPVVDRYRLALELQPGEKGHFALGQYMDFLLRSRSDEAQDEITHVIGTDEFARKYAVETLRCYAECLRHGSNYIFQSMPRLLTLWFEVCALDPGTPTRGGGGGGISRDLSTTSSRATALSGNNSEFVDLRQTQRSCTTIVQAAMTEVPPYMWYTCLPQLMSRVGHPKDEVVAVVSQALVNIISAHPHQALWQVSGLALSLSETRRKIGQRIINRATLCLRKEGDAECVKDAIQLFEELITVAMDKPDSASRGNASYVIGKNINLKRFVVPTQAALTVSLPNKVVKPPVAISKRKQQKNRGHQQQPRYEQNVIFPRGQLHIRKFWERVRIMPSKAQPKKISLQTVEGGETVHFLCKQERNGDLRKDARLMEFNGVVNRLLARDNSGRRRKLRLRTYSVICLNEECGIIEWVQGTTAFRHLVSEGYRIGPPRKGISNDQLKDLMKRIQEKTGSLEEMVDIYRCQLLPRFPPSLHRWFTDHFREPTAWFDGRTTFTRSAALWSAVGHVVGLGDRHGENLLLHTEGGECVHVDFDCLFDKGLILARPEIVPFRLTPNMVDGMGVTGYEGGFRRVMEVTMQVLRDNRRLLLSVLEPFLQDPTVGWWRIGRAQRPTDEKLGEKGREDKLRQSRHSVAQDVENEDAKRTLRIIEGRLRGVYNLKVPRKRRKLLPLRKGDPRPVQQKETNELPLSVPGQVQRLIHESVSHENLCQMYIGWLPWL